MDGSKLHRITVNGVTVDFDSGLLRDGTNAEVPLRAQSFAVLRELARNAGRVVSKDELIGTVWNGVAVTDDSLVQCVGDIRRALRDEAQTVLKTVPKRGYRLTPPAVDAPLASPAAPGARRGLATRVATFCAALAALLLIGAGVFWRGAEPVMPAGGPPSIAVLPFDDMSADQALGYLGEGVADDIISMLARSPDVLVMARGSSFKYGDDPKDVREIGAELGVAYVLEGSVRREGDKLRIIAELSDTDTGEHIWAERYDETGTDPLALQDGVAARVLNALTGELGQLKQAQFREAWGKDSANLGEYDYFLRALDIYIDAEDKETYDRAAAILREGLAKFPDSAMLKTKLAWYHWSVAWEWMSDDITADFRAADRLVTEVLATDNLAPEARRAALWLNAFVLMQRGEYELSVKEAEYAVAMVPYDARMLRSLTDVLASSGKYDMALDWLARAEAREPGRPDKYHLARGYLYRLMGRYEESVQEYELNQPLWPYPRMSLAISYVNLGRIDEAKEQVRLAMADAPDWTQAIWREGSPYSDPAILDAEVADLASAGLPP